MLRKYYVYILTNKRNGTLYIGVTSDLIKRVWQHKNDIFEGFSKKYKTHRLIYFEEYSSIELALNREKRLKNWQRTWKIELVEAFNPYWRDLYENMV